MGAMSRIKGASGERELCKAIFDHLGVRVGPNLEQSRSGGHDLDVHPDESGPVADALRRYAIEVKRHCKATPGLITGWWLQAEEQATRTDRTPALIYRADRMPWRVVIPLAALVGDQLRLQGIEWTAEVGIVAFCALLREGG